jgi:hypothetical protein
MGDAFIYYRLESNNSHKQSNTPTSGYVSTPQLLKTNFPNQVLEFTLPDELLSSVDMTYENNIKDAPISNPDGTRRINKQDNGLNRISFSFRGRFKDASSDIQKLIDFAVLKQVESSGNTNANQFGVFGFYTDNTTIKPFNIDPDGTKGLTINGFNIHRDGQRPKTFDFSLSMTFGGTFT